MNALCLGSSDRLLWKQGATGSIPVAPIRLGASWHYGWHWRLIVPARKGRPAAFVAAGVKNLCHPPELSHKVTLEDIGSILGDSHG